MRVAARILRTSLAAAVATALVGACPEARGAGPETLRISGCGTDLGTFRLMAEAFHKAHPGKRLEVLPSLGSAGGIKAVLAGALDLASSARPLTADEQRQGATAIPYARTPLVVAVAEKSRTTSVMTRQLVDLYGGATRTWPDGTPVRLILRPETDMDTAVLMTLSPAVRAAVSQALAREGLVVAATDQEAADALERVPGALGSTTLALVRSEGRALRPLALDGVAPTPQSLAAGRYPLSKTLYLVLGPSPSPAALEFLTFLGSATARRILHDTGHAVVPLSPRLPRSPG